MEVITHQHGNNLLSTKVFFSDEDGFEVASVIIMGKTEAILIDAQWTLSNAHRLVAEILETGRHLKELCDSCPSGPLFWSGHLQRLFRMPGLPPLHLQPT